MKAPISLREYENRRILAAKNVRNYRLLADSVMIGCFVIPFLIWLAVVAAHFRSR